MAMLPLDSEVLVARDHLACIASQGDRTPYESSIGVVDAKDEPSVLHV
jgi:hypothetical protein